MKLADILVDLGVDITPYKGQGIAVFSPIDGATIAELQSDSELLVHEKITKAKLAFTQWRQVPAPKRGELVRIFADLLRNHQLPLARLISVESGKIFAEAKGEVQEMIDICEYAVGLSRTFHGLTLPSERPEHQLAEYWHPLGVVGIISAFNFPVAVWAWNAAIALVCGNSILWKPSELTPLCAIACQHLLLQAIEQYRAAGATVPASLSAMILGDKTHGMVMAQHPDIALLSATGSCKMGQEVAPVVAARMGKILLELGGNNAVIITPSASLDIAIPSVIFGAVGTTGQRCTSTRRAFVHVDYYDEVVKRLRAGYQTIIGEHIGDPLIDITLVGPLIHSMAYRAMEDALTQAQKEGGEVVFGKRIDMQYPDAYYVEPALVLLKEQTTIALQETFAPILYVIPYRQLDEVMVMHNDVSQGLSSAIFTKDITEAEYFKTVSDCGIANVNIGTSGAEIGGAFGGEKATGGGRESGSDSWKYYMRRQTSTTYYGRKPPILAQGIEFKVS